MRPSWTKRPSSRAAWRPAPRSPMPRSSAPSMRRRRTRSTSSSISSATASGCWARARTSRKASRRSSPSGRPTSRDDEEREGGMTYQTILLGKADGLATVTLNAPDKLNAVSRKMIGELKNCWEELAADASVRAVLLTGAGRGFCAGADLADPDRDMSATADAGAALDKFFNPVIRLMRALPKPIVAAVNGVAAGVGMSFAMASDIAVAGKSASFLQAFARIGLLPDGGSTWFLPRLVGDQRARALAMLAPQIGAQQAKDWGLIWDVVEDAELMPKATEIARKLADGPTLALARIKEALNQAGGNDLSHQLDLERDSQRVLGKTEDFKEGVMAFLAKRKAEFKGK